MIVLIIIVCEGLLFCNISCYGINRVYELIPGHIKKNCDVMV